MVLEGRADTERTKGRYPGVGAQGQRNWGRTCECTVPRTRQERSGELQLKLSTAATPVALLRALEAFLRPRRGTGKAAGPQDCSAGRRGGLVAGVSVLILPACPAIFPETSNLSVPEASVSLGYYFYECLGL